MDNQEINDRITETDRFISFVHPHRLIEMRVKMPDNHWRSGRYDDSAKMARHAAQMQIRHGAQAVYFSLNHLRPEATHIGAAEPNIMLGRARRGRAATNRDIASRDIYLVDIDSVHPSGMMATDAERGQAFEVAARIDEYLASLGWPDPIRLDSGNGCHLLFQGDNCGADSAAWKHVLGHLAEKFSTAGALVDRSVADAAQISRLPGTVNAKGPNSLERPHRLSRVIAYPTTWEPLQHSFIYRLAISTGFSSDTPTDRKRPNSNEEIPELLATEEDVIKIIEEYPTILSLRQMDRRADGVYFYLDECPFAGHKHQGGPEKSALILREKTLGFRCFSDDCEGNNWQKLKALLYNRTGRWPSVQVYARTEACTRDENELTEESILALEAVAEERLKETPEWQRDAAEWERTRPMTKSEFRAIAMKYSL
jgi:hypothetical protein